MLKENWRVISFLERLGDNLIVVIAFLIAYYGRDSLLFWDSYFDWGLPFGGAQLAPLSEYIFILLVSLASYATVLQMLGAYSSMRFSSHLRLAAISIISSVIVFFLLAAILFTLKIDLSRSFILLFCVLVSLSLAAERFLMIRLLRWWRRRGLNFRSILIVGVSEQALKLAKKIADRPELGIRIRGFVALAPDDDFSLLQVHDFRVALRQQRIARVPRIFLGVSGFRRLLGRHAIDELIFTDVTEVMGQVEEMILLCSEQGIRTTIAADLFSLGMVKSAISYFDDMPLIHFQTPPGDSWELAVKRALDIFVSALLLCLLSPFFLLIALLIKLTSKGPVLFIQKRVGLNGRIFNMYKFRSMLTDAKELFAQLKEHNEMQGPVFKMKNDPRVTAIGRFLRRFSLDELPQLWNVFIGDMSLVGPRPPIPGEVNAYERKSRRRLSMRPGLTCTWQVSGRNEIKDFSTWVKMDLEYIDNWSLVRDFVLLIRTIPAVLLGTGAR